MWAGDLALCLDKGEGVAAPDYPAASEWHMRAADAGVAEAANNLCRMYTVGRGRAWQMMPASSHIQNLVYWVKWRHLTLRALSARPWGAASRVASRWR
jgi:TPR repeat protein